MTTKKKTNFIIVPLPRASVCERKVPCSNCYSIGYTYQFVVLISSSVVFVTVVLKL